MRALVALFALALAPVAHGQDALSMEYDAAVSAGQTPTLRLTANEPVTATVALSCDGHRVRWTDAIAAGATAAIPLSGAETVGTHRCEGELSIVAATGASGSMPVSFDVSVLTGLALDAAFEDIDLAGGMVTVHADRPLAHVRVTAIGVDGTEVGRGSLRPNDANPRLQWFPNDREVVRLEIEAEDADGVAARLTLVPWSYAIPHDDVIFETNQATIRDSEVPKLEEAWRELQRVLAKYGDVVEVQLFVGGYTDTVGERAANRALSERRARAIATWFRERGFQHPIHFQGFGEDVLAVPTADGVDDARNRRAVYVLAAAPPTSDDFPTQRWTPLP